MNNDSNYKLLCNNILALLINMSDSQLNYLNKDIPSEILMEFDLKYKTKPSQIHYDNAINALEAIDNKGMVLWNYSSDSLVNIEGVMLPIFDKKNYLFFKNHNMIDEQEDIVLVESAKVNLHSLALGVAAGKAICLSGPVGSGKTTLVHYLAKQTGRIAPKFIDVKKIAKLEINKLKEHTVTNGNGHSSDKTGKNNKRKMIEYKQNEDDDYLTDYQKSLKKEKATNGFLRIQLGDQTDSKMLLGQYRCTDVPGEFVWQPGVLTQVLYILLFIQYCLVLKISVGLGCYVWLLATTRRHRFMHSGCLYSINEFVRKQLS